MTTTSYILAWAIYLFSACAITAIVWNLSTHWRPAELKYALRISMIILIYTPYISVPEQNKLAPAVLISLFEFGFGNHDTALRAATPMLMMLLATFAISFIVHLSKRITKKPQNLS